MAGKHEPGHVERCLEILAKDGVACGDKNALLEALGAIEKAVIIWERKSDGHKAASARTMIAAVRSALPDLGQTPLETAKLASNRDVGSAVLEALSRVLESRVATMARMIDEVLAVGTTADGSGEEEKVRLADRAYLEWHAGVARAEAAALT